MKKPCSATDPLWYKDAVIYEIHVRAFADSNDDGIGDFPGLLSKLDYLQQLGVTCLWLLPFFPSPGRDDGYDIADYVNVNPAYGTLQDFQAFLAAAHARNMQVMIELVINHTSDQHPWFQKARHAPKGSPERNVYVWSDTDKLYDGVRIIFTDTEKSNWTWDEVAQQYYWHRFFSHQPDLNFDNPQVMEEVLNAMRFWMDMGVDGLRLDAIPYLVERDGTSCENVPETHVVIKKIRAAIDAEYENRLVLAEANMWPADVRPYFGDGDECNMAFHFPLMPRIYMALRQEDRLPITDIMAQTPEIPESCQWGLFLRNHDELTLEMVTDDERDYMNLAYAADTRMRINVGIRRRLAPLMDNNRRRIELLNSLLLSFPGTPILYYGDEIGMGDNIYLGDRNGVRTPMQWNPDRNAGFSRCDPARLYFPVIMDPIYGYQAINVEAQNSDASSLLHWTRNMIALRKIFQVFGRGTLEFLAPENRKVLAYIRDCDFPDGHSETVLCVANLSRFAQPVRLDLSKYAGRHPVEMLGYVPFPPIDETLYAITLAPYAFFWLELQPADAPAVPPISEDVDITAPNPVILSETPTPTSVVSTEPPASKSVISTEAKRSGETPVFTTSNTGTTLDIAATIATLTPQIESALPTYIATQRWFGNKSRTIASTRITSTTPITDTALIALIEITYAPLASGIWQSGNLDSKHPATDLYQLPLALATTEQAATLQTTAPKSIITTLNNRILFDASADPTFQQALLNLITTTNPGTPSSPTASSSAKVGPTTEALAATKSTALDPTRLADVPSRLSSAEQSNTSILYDSLAILKLFRHIRLGAENPDVEIARFLTETAHFTATPTYLGDIHRATDNATLAFLQTFAPNEGDGWAWTLTQLEAFYKSVAGTPIDLSSRPELPATDLSSRPNPEPAEGEVERPAGEPAQMPELNGHATPYLEAAKLLGQRTAELHLALATPTTNPAFAATPYTTEDLTHDRTRIEAQLNTTLDALQAWVTSQGSAPGPSVATATEQVPQGFSLGSNALAKDGGVLTPEENTSTLAQKLLASKPQLLKTIQALTGDPTTFGYRIRIHGDYHLGQLLRTKDDFLIVDFEGEPARPLEERRQKQSPLRDVAGMLRSFSYAARTGLNNAPQPTDAAWATAWETAVSTAFLNAYRSTIAANPNLLPTPQHAESLLNALLLEKALYELLYELNNRPAWLPIPLEGLLQLLTKE